ncbi:MAG: alpha/beta hydrolase [bacterium]|nr:alpha/beta hydrolase [bacterium]
MQDYFPRIPEEYVVPLNMNGLRGRMLRMPPPKNKKREMLVVYGHHSSLERMYSIAEVLNDYGGVTMPDLPGFGGMDSFYKIGEKPHLDTMADYLASVVKLRYKNRRVTIAGISYGFIVVTRMLQRYPELTKKVDMLISVVGFAHHEEFTFSRKRKFLYRLGTKIFSQSVPAAIFRSTILHPFILRNFYKNTHNAKIKFAGLSEDETKNLAEFEVVLWRLNDLRTHMATNNSFLYVDNCIARVNLPVYHIGVDMDHYFDKELVEQHMRVIFNDFQYINAPVDRHMPNVIAGKEESAVLFPRKIRTLLNKKQ